MSVRSGQSVTKEFRTRRFDTGALADADSTPSGTLYVNGTANAASVTVTRHSTGKYKAAVTLPTLAIGDLVELEIAATVNSVSDAAVIWYDAKDVLLDASGKTTDAVQTGDSYARLTGTGAVTFASLTVTGAFLVSAGATFTNATGSGFTCSSSGSNGHGLNLSGNGSGDGLSATGGGTGVGAHLIGGSTAGQGLNVVAGGSAADGATFSGVGSGAGVRFTAGATGPGVNVTTTAGNGISVTPTGGHALVLTADGTSKHGMLITGGTGGTSDGLKAVAGTGGVPIRGDVTGNVTGNLSGSVGSISGVTFPTNFATLAIDGSGYVHTGYFGVSAVVHTSGKVWALDGSGNAVAPASATTALQAIFSGITSLAQWLGLLAGKQTGNSTARTEVRATGAGSGTFDETTDSQEALRDRGDAAWAVPAHFTNSTFSADGVFATAALANAPSGGGGGSAPTVNEIVDGLLDELLSGHTVVGSVGAGIAAAGSAGDPWATAQPGAYGSGTYGYLVAAALNPVLAAGPTITIVAPAPSDGGTSRLIRGDSYQAADGLALRWNSATGLDLSTATVKLRLHVNTAADDAPILEVSVTVTGTAGAWVLSADLTAAQTTDLTRNRYGVSVHATLANTHPHTLLRGIIEMRG